MATTTAVTSAADRSATALGDGSGVWNSHGPPGKRAPSRTESVTVALIPAVLMLGMGLWGIRRENSMWRDESTTYQVAHRSLDELWHLLGSIDAVHGLYYLFMHAVYALWDGGLLALRLPSVLAMAVAAAGVALAGRRLAGPRAGLAAGLAFPLLPMVQKYAQEGRSYAFVCAAVAWATYLLLGAVDEPRRRTWCAYAAVLSVGCLLHEFAVLVLLAHGAALFKSRVPRTVLWSWARAALGVAVVLAPLALISKQQEAQIASLEPPSGMELLRFGILVAPGALFACVRPTVRGLPARGPAGGLRTVDLRTVDLRTVGLFLLVLPSAVLMLVSFFHPLYSDRYVMYSAIGLALLAGGAVDRALRALPTVLVAVLVVAVLAGLLPAWLQVRRPEVHMDDTNATAAAVARMTRTGDGVLFTPWRRREGSLSHPQEYRGLRDLAQAESPRRSGTLWGVELPAERIRTRVRAVDRVLVLSDPPSGEEDGPENAQERAKRDVLKQNFRVCAREKAGRMVLTLYAARPGLCQGRS
ncbi:glycosyltransferase family 39 protein [Streptomyces sp. 3N207]|uniref:glycosyltransferase family 39 protein n=1 Tax=Streptomyces sp. 3N207 TaxID=3457417 RepID=UPI003FCF9FD3